MFLGVRWQKNYGAVVTNVFGSGIVNNYFEGGETFFGEAANNFWGGVAIMFCTEVLNYLGWGNKKFWGVGAIKVWQWGAKKFLGVAKKILGVE